MTSTRNTMDDRTTPTAEKAAPRRVTMTDIARRAGCSQATVSFVLNNAPGAKISADTRNRVIEAARSLNYATAVFAHLQHQPGEVQTRPKRLGFIVDQLTTSPEAVVAIEGARQAAMDDGSILLAAQTMNDPEIEDQTIDAFVATGVSALIYMTIFTRKIVLPASLRNLAIPVVLLNCYDDTCIFPSVIPGELEGGQRAASHLATNGHRRIAMITGEPWMEATRDRMTGYRRALAAADIPFDPELVFQGNWSPSSGYIGTQRLLALPARPTAIFCQNDRMAIGCYEALKEASLHIPGDMSVAGYDDEDISFHLYPKLTTVVLPHRAMGVWAVENLAAKARVGGKYPVVKLECQLIERHSVAQVYAPL
jgi:LacI family transcriptional regulator